MREETGLDVLIGDLVYVEEFHSPETRHCKFWFLALPGAGTLSVEQPEARAEHIVEVAWHPRQAMDGLHLFPEVVRSRFWMDRERGFDGLRHLGQRAMQFW